jgi:adenylate cyclase
MAAGFVDELKRRKVVRVGLAYAVAGAVIIGVASDAFPSLGIPGWGVTLVIALVVLGFPLAVVLSWMFDLTSGGIERTVPAPSAAGGSPGTGPVARAPASAEHSSATGIAEASAGAATPPAASAKAVAAAPTADSPPLTSLAVLPLSNMSGSEENEYFSDGMTEDILAQIATIGALDVVSHTSVKRYKGTDKPIREIAAELAVGCVLEGSVRRAGDRVRIVAQLIDARADRHIWAETYDRELTDIFAVQSDVARSIAAALEAELTEDEQAQLDRTPTDSIEAYELVLRGRHELAILQGPHFIRAIELFEQALEIQPDYQEALGSFSLAHMALPFWGAPSPDERAELRASLESLIETVDSSSAAGHCLSCALDQVYRWDWDGASRHAEAALRLAPELDVAHLLRGNLQFPLGRLNEAIQQYAETTARFPGPMAAENTGHLLCLARRYEDAIELLEPWIEREPSHHIPPFYTGVSYVRLGQIEKGLALMERGRQISNKNPIAEIGYANVLTRLGRDDEAREAVGELFGRAKSQYVPPYALAAISLVTGDLEEALNQLEAALAERDPILPYLRAIPRWRELYGNPRFDAVFRAIYPGEEPPALEPRS